MKRMFEIIDSSDGKHAQKTLSDENETLRLVFNSLAEGVIVADKDGKFLFFNPVAKKILGIGSKNVTPQEWTSVYGCYYSDRITPYPSEKLPLARAINNEEVSNEIIFIKNPERPKGVYISVSANPLRDENGFVCGGTVILQDITERRLAEAALKKLSNAVEQTADSVIITNKQGIIEFVNPAFEETTGYNREEVLNQTPQILKSGKHNSAFYKNLWKTLLEGKSYRGTIINKKKNSELYWSEQTITPMKDEQGNITNFVSVLKDITELRQKQEQEFQLRLAQELQQRLLKANASLPGFDIAGATYSAVETSGDYFDFLSLSDGSLGLVVGDVSGHGIGPALIMAETRAYLRAFAKRESDPAILLTWLNQELAADLEGEHFVTLILARLDPQQNLLDYASAGHVPAYLLNGSGEVAHIMRSTGIPLGIIPNYKFNTGETLKLAPKDMMLLLTDGIKEARSPDGTEFGFDRTLDIIKNHQQQATAQQIVEHLYQAVRSFSKNQPQEDDITSIICKVNPD